MFCIALFYYYLNYAVMMSNDPFRDKIHIIARHILNEDQRSLRDSTISHGVCVGEMLVLKAICDALTH